MSFNFKDTDSLKTVLTNALNAKYSDAKYPFTNCDIHSVTLIEKFNTKAIIKIKFTKTKAELEFVVDLIDSLVFSNYADDMLLGWRKIYCMFDTDYKLIVTEKELYSTILYLSPPGSMHLLTDEFTTDTEMLANPSKYFSYIVDASSGKVTIKHRSIVFSDFVIDLDAPEIWLTACKIDGFKDSQWVGLS